MKGHQVGAPIALTQASRQRTNDFFLLGVIDAAVAAQNPNQTLFLVTPTQPFAVDDRVFLSEKRLPIADLVVPVSTPRRKKADTKAQLVGLIDNVVHMVPVIVAGAVLHVRSCRIKVHQGTMPVGVRYSVAVEFG